MRDIYHQSIGNPLQLNRLPKRRPQMQLPYHPYSAAKDAWFAVSLLSALIALSLAATGAQLMHISAKQPFNTPSLVGTNVILIAVGLFLMVKALREKDVRWILTPLAGVIAATICLNLHLPFTLQWGVACAALGLVSWLFARHWTFLCTASPLGRTTATQLRRNWNRILLPVAFVPLGIFLLAHFVPGPFILAILLAGCIFLLILSVLAPGERRAFHTCWQSLLSWLTYNRHDMPVPGIFRSPAGRWLDRMSLTGLCVFLLAVSYARSPNEAITPTGIDPWALFVVACSPLAVDVSGCESLDAIVFQGILFGITLILPVLITIAAPLILNLPILVLARSFQSSGVSPKNWRPLINEMRRSVDPIERDSLYGGRVANDGSPVIVPRGIFGEHAHFLGDTGTGKTSRGVAPLIEQLGLPGRCSIIVIDLKADSMELLATLLAVASYSAKLTGHQIPVKHVSNQLGRSTFACNALRQPYWKNLDTYTRTDILCGALGLTYGVDYGEGFYSSANAAVLYHTLDKYPDVETCKELAERVGYITSNASRAELHPEIRRAGSHVKVILDRLGSFEFLNVVPDRGYAPEVLSEAIDFTRVFQQPEFHYYHLSSTLAPGASPEMARLVTYSLLSAATQVKRRFPVFVVIDEFQRMVARNIEYMLQLARSMDVGIILANQTMEDLRTSTADLVPAIEANCRYRQWFSVSASRDRSRLIEGSGETVDHQITRTRSQGPNGQTQSVSFQERVVPRISINDILLASDHPKQSILRISRGDGYAQYGGLPFIMESDYHISQTEYTARKATPWPSGVPGSFTPGTVSQKPKAPPAGPSVSTVVVGSAPRSPGGAANLFSSFLGSSPSKPAKKTPSKGRP